MNRRLQDWKFTQLGGGEGTKDGEWLPVSQFPTTVHVELLNLKRIPDPFLALAEWDVQWVGESQWAFKTQFTVDADDIKYSNADLVFEGIDTFASVLLNGNEILKADNQFLSYRVPVKPHLKEGANELVLNFDSAFTVGREIEKNHDKLLLWNGDSSRLHVRKAQYNYGWDWGPVLMTTGPWKPVRLHSYDNRITDLDVRTQVSESLDVKLDAKFTFEKKKGYASFVLKRPDGTEEVSAPKIPTDNGVGEVSFKFPSGHLQLWYPIAYGAQPLYTVQVELTDLASLVSFYKILLNATTPQEGNVLDTQTQKIGIRRARVVQEKLVDQDGLSFLFEINNIRIFCGGSNWIPADSFLTIVTAERYRAWLELLVKGNQNMVRVWGGGIYEADVFYDICDELGVLVWQDFMFGCGQYPAYESFLDSVQIEAEQNVKRLRSHPSIVIFAGNNEDYQLAESSKLELDYSDEKSDYLKTNFPARHIYERLLPAVVEKLSDTFYHRGSPYSGQGKITTDPAYGDIHQWNVWHGLNEPWHNWDKLAGRFVSEFGMQGFPNIRTVDYWLDGDKSERYPQSRINNNHNKADGFERRLELYLVENFKHSFEMESYVYYTQIMQAETLASAYRLWRRNWAGKGREYTAGALVWQINDCWPVTSWAIADYFLRPKPAYFAIARELRPYTVGMTRKEKKVFANELSSAQFTIDTVLEIWGTNSTLVDHKVTVEVTSFDLQSDCWRDKWSKEIVLKANSGTEVHKGTVPGQPIRSKTSQVPKMIVVSARLIAESGEVLARYSNWPEPFKFINFPPDTAVKAIVDGESVTLSTNRPVKGIVLDVEGPEVQWSDQAIDLVPDDPQIVQAVGLNGRDVKLRYLGDGTA
ncbi:glycoside hydrolase family 2 protein [Mycena sanguinolenta]|nr:glycoside hydrolase family 2 protein [Mycena sanguinolenta]